MPPTIAEITEELRDVALQVSSAQERVEDREAVSTAHLSVERLSQRYRELCASLGEDEKLKVERMLGRRLTDIKRLASLLPRVGTLDHSTPDRRVTGASEVGERRITGVSWTPPGRAVRASGAKSVGQDIESWCGPCGELTNHSIVAMIGTEPKQVVCQTCGSRHGFRTTPARKPVAASAPEATAARETNSSASKNAEKKAQELRALALEVAGAAEVRSFDPRGRYKAGEIISHAEFGRGKVETVLRSSLLVRFANGGMKSILLT